MTRFRVPTISTLPLPTADRQGELWRIRGDATTPGSTWECREDGAGAWEWVQIDSGADLSSIESDITALQGDVGTLQTDLATDQGNLATHIVNVANPHAVTLPQVGVTPIVYPGNFTVPGTAYQTLTNLDVPVLNGETWIIQGVLVCNATDDGVSRMTAPVGTIDGMAQNEAGVFSATVFNSATGVDLAGNGFFGGVVVFSVSVAPTADGTVQFQVKSADGIATGAIRAGSFLTATRVG